MLLHVGLAVRLQDPLVAPRKRTHALHGRGVRTSHVRLKRVPRSRLKRTPWKRTQIHRSDVPRYQLVLIQLVLGSERSGAGGIQTRMRSPSTRLRGGLPRHHVSPLRTLLGVPAVLMDNPQVLHHVFPRSRPLVLRGAIIPVRAHVLH